MSPAGLEEIIDIDNNFTARKYHIIATTTFLFYDFLLTLADEIKYGWQGKKSWVFAIFLANRYFPVAYQIWLLYASFSTTLNQRLYECDSTMIFEVLTVAIITLLAQIVLTLRIYAVTRMNGIIASCFGVITISQFVLGLYMAACVAKGGPSLNLLPVHAMCTFVGHLHLPSAVGFLAMSVTYDVLAFSVIIYLAVRSNVTKIPIPTIFKTIVQDATYYFLVIFTSQLVLVMFIAFASSPIKFLPAAGNIMFLPIMITRLLLSLKKAGSSKEDEWSFGGPTTHTTIRFADCRLEGGVATRDETSLDTFSGARERT